MRLGSMLTALLLASGCTPKQSAQPAEIPINEARASTTAAAPAAANVPAAPSLPSTPGTPPAPSPAPAAAVSGTTDLTANPTAPSLAQPVAPVPLAADLEPKLTAILRSHQLQGVIARLDGDARAARCSDLARCKRALVPASTFKIPNSIIGLETGVIPDADFLIAWDGVDRGSADWNHDHTLRTAIRDSAVWYFQELARRVGTARMRAWLQRLGYGNMQTGEVVDRFWLDGPLAITPLEQVAFLRRLALAQLPISARTRSIALDITLRGAIDGKPFHGKSGWAHPHEPSEVGWFVGFVEDPTNPRYVAVALGPVPKGVDMMTIRQAIAEEALRLPLE
jgi:beta-lactamase class D